LDRMQLLRKLFVETAKQMQKSYTFNEIAGMFFQYGIIDIPEKPYGAYSGSKYDYVLDRLTNTKNIDGFLDMISEVWFELSNIRSEGNSSQIEWLLRKLGFTESIEKNCPSIYYLEPPKNFLISQKNNDSLKRIDISNIPTEIQKLISELNDNTLRKNVYACALLIRKIITLTVFIALRKKGKETLLKDATGNDIELNRSLSILKTELKISDHIMSKVISAKWIGDSANHSYQVRINNSDIEIALTGLRIFLEEVFN